MRPSIPEGNWEIKALRSLPYCLRLACASLAAIALLHCTAESPVSSDSEGAPTAGAERAAPETGGKTAVAAETKMKAREDAPVVLFLGTSITAGYGLPEDEAFPALIGERIQESGLDFRVVNAGVSGDTSAGGRRRLDWLLRMPIAVLVLELGANDMLRGQSVDQLKTNLEAILDQTAARHPEVRFVIAGMRAAPNLGREYGEAFDAVYPALAKSYDAALVPFLLEDVAARRNLNQTDGIHPTAEGHRLIAKRLWPTLEPVLR